MSSCIPTESCAAQRKADGLVAGAAHSTSDTRSAGLQILKLRPGETGFRAFLHASKSNYLFAIAVWSRIRMPNSSRDRNRHGTIGHRFDIEPTSLFFHTRRKALPRAASLRRWSRLPNLPEEGEGSVRLTKRCVLAASCRRRCPGERVGAERPTAVAGAQRVLIFPESDAGNIAYNGPVPWRREAYGQSSRGSPR